MLNKGGLYATSGHVTNFDEQNLVIVHSDSNLLSYQDTSNTQVKYTKVKIYASDPIRDICILQSENDIQVNLSAGGADDVIVGNEISIIGFPHCTEGRRVLTFQSISVGAKVLIETSNVKSKHLIINIQARPGQSGSPILRGSDGKLIAMLLGSWAPGGGGGISLGGVDPHTLHQTTHAISAEYITAMI